jgi:hypothetical protein
LLSQNAVKAQIRFKTFKKNPIPIVSTTREDYEDPYSGDNLLDYHDFKRQGKSPWAATKGDWYLKYKKMFDFRCKEPFWGVSPRYLKNNYLKSGYKFRLVDNQIIEDSISFLSSKYFSNNTDTLKKWNLPPSNDNRRTEKIIKLLGLEHFKFVITVFDSKKHSKFIEVPEAEQANDNMVYMEVFKYPADVDIFLFNFQKNNWEYVETVTVSGDHELELYVLQKFEPRYLKDCELKK